jgi:hypothetical protein
MPAAASTTLQLAQCLRELDDLGADYSTCVHTVADHKLALAAVAATRDDIQAIAAGSAVLLVVLLLALAVQCAGGSRLARRLRDVQTNDDLMCDQLNQTRAELAKKQTEVDKLRHEKEFAVVHAKLLKQQLDGLTSACGLDDHVELLVELLQQQLDERVGPTSA